MATATGRRSAIVVGAGAWGLPAALDLQDRGWDVTLIERFEPGGPSASNGGSTRLWRLADTQPWRARSLRGTLDAMDRLSERLGEPVYRRTGLLWRDDASLPAVAESLVAIGEPVERIAADRVAEVFAGLRPDGRDALYVEQAGVVHIDRLLGRSLTAFIAAGGVYLSQTRVTAIEPGAASATVRLAGGERRTADQVLVAAGPGTAELLPGLGIALPLTPYIEQVVYVGDPGAVPPAAPAPDLPGLVDCPPAVPTEQGPDSAGVYAMPNGPLGYKIGLDRPLRSLAGGTLGDDLDRSPVATRTETIRARVARDLTSIVPQVLGTQVCTWTDSGDGDFIIGRIHPSVVLACGDSGEGFKYAAFMGEYLAALVVGEPTDAEFDQHWDPARFGTETAPRRHYSPIGRH
ncbi:FAD-dependent oxidoreductase [Leucobacter sp. NPDC077196]|uniref:NAD(P)/FAD-dependent oxidoreductase n=1 Tax=Leucobacter sp. NPDC077196 TaxID=3154959 RepID=UPI003414E3DA